MASARAVQPSEPPTSPGTEAPPPQQGSSHSPPPPPSASPSSPLVDVVATSPARDGGPTSQHHGLIVPVVGGGSDANTTVPVTVAVSDAQGAPPAVTYLTPAGGLCEEMLEESGGSACHVFSGHRPALTETSFAHGDGGGGGGGGNGGGSGSLGGGDLPSPTDYDDVPIEHWVGCGDSLNIEGNESAYVSHASPRGADTAPVSPLDGGDPHLPAWSVKVPPPPAMEASREEQKLSLDDLVLFGEYDAVHFVEVSYATGFDVITRATGILPEHGVVVICQLVGKECVIRQLVCRRVVRETEDAKATAVRAAAGQSVVTLAVESAQGASPADVGDDDATGDERGMTEDPCSEVSTRIGPAPLHVCHFRLRRAGEYRLSYGDDVGTGATIVVGQDPGVDSPGLYIDPFPSGSVPEHDASHSAALGGGAGASLAPNSREQGMHGTDRHPLPPVDSAPVMPAPKMPSAGDIAPGQPTSATGWGVPIPGASWDEDCGAVPGIDDEASRPLVSSSRAKNVRKRKKKKEKAAARREAAASTAAAAAPTALAGSQTNRGRSSSPEPRWGNCSTKISFEERKRRSQVLKEVHLPAAYNAGAKIRNQPTPFPEESRLPGGGFYIPEGPNDELPPPSAYEVEVSAMMMKVYHDMMAKLKESGNDTPLPNGHTPKIYDLTP